MTTTVYCRGSEWSKTAWLDGRWGDGVDGEAVLRWMVERFNEAATEAGSSAFWLPSVGEVHGTHNSDPSYNEPEEIDFADIRDRVAEQAGKIIEDGGTKGAELGWW